jgi:hypothetical protein
MSEIKLDKTQERVFRFMTDFGSITSLEAITELGETRLSARIWELRHKGIHIHSDWIKVKNRYGESRTVKRYYIGDVA